MPCLRHIGCHGCAIEYLEPEMREFRRWLVAFLILPSTHVQDAKEKALQLKSRIDKYYDADKENENEELAQETVRKIESEGA